MQVQADQLNAPDHLNMWIWEMGRPWYRISCLCMVYTWNTWFSINKSIIYEVLNDRQFIFGVV